MRGVITHPTLGNLLMVAACVLGLLSVGSIQRETMPQVAPNEVEVRVVYAGASASEVEEAICRPLEEALASVTSLDEVRAEAREGLGLVTLEMVEGSNFTEFQAAVEREVDALDTLPDDAEDPVVEALGLEQKVLALIVSVDGTTQGLKAYCEDLERRLRLLPEVSLVEVQGFGEHQLRVELEPEALARYGLGPVEVAEAISSQSVDMPAGTLETRTRDVLVRFVERRRTTMELEDLVVRSRAGGAEVRLRELGRVVDLFDDPENSVWLDGRRAGRLLIEKSRDEDSMRIADAVRAFVEAERDVAPDSTALYITEDQSIGLRGQIEMVVRNGWQGMILVALSLWLFFSGRLAFWVVMGLPVSILGAIVLMPVFGLTINMLTLIGFLLALGLLMDDAIVIAEAIATQRRRGLAPVAAALAGLRQVWVGVFASFLTTICVLGPLVLIGGDIGQLLRVVPMVLILTLAVSLIEALGILPGHLAHALHRTPVEPTTWFRRKFEALMDFVRERLVGGLADLAVRWRWPFVGTVVGLLLVSLGLFAGGRIAFEAMPELEGDVMVARVLMPQGTPLATTREVVARIERGLEATDAEWSPRQPDGAPLVLGSHVRLGENVDAFESGPHLATISVDLRTAEERVGRLDDYLNSWRLHSGPLPDVLNVSFTPPTTGSAGQPIEIRLAGEDLDELATASAEVVDFLDDYVGTANLMGDLRPGKPELLLSLLPGAKGLGLDARSLGRQVAAAIGGTTADELQLGPEAYEIDVRLAASGRDSLEDLELLRIPVGEETLPLPAVADVKTGRGWSRITRIDGRRTATVRGDVDVTKGNTSEILRAFEESFGPELAVSHPNIELSYSGEAKNSSETQRSMMTNMLMGLLGVFALLSVQFRSYAEPLIVMVAIPLSLIGVLGGHLLLGFPFTLPSMLGFISLAGVVVNDSILLVETLKADRRAGRSIADAAGHASRARFRAVLLTSSTTIAGLLPMLAETSLQAQIVRGLVISVSFGLMASTVLILFVVPALYALLGDLGLATPVEPQAGRGVEAT